MDESQKHCFEEKKPNIQKTKYACIYMMFMKGQN